MVTPELIKRLFEERREAISNDVSEKRQHDAEMAHIVTAQASTVLTKSDGHEVWGYSILYSIVYCTTVYFSIYGTRDGLCCILWVILDTCIIISYNIG